MNLTSRPFARAALRLAAALVLAQLAYASARAQQTPPPRRPSGPAAGPVIKLPRGEGASPEQTQADADGREGRASAEPRRWEYCAIKGFNWHTRGLNTRVPAAVIRYFSGDTEEVEGGLEEEAVFNAFAKLGEEGWELAGVETHLSLTDGHGTTRTTYYFKRPRRQE